MSESAQCHRYHASAILIRGAIGECLSTEQSDEEREDYAHHSNDLWEAVTLGELPWTALQQVFATVEIDSYRVTRRHDCYYTITPSVPYRPRRLSTITRTEHTCVTASYLSLAASLNL